MLLELLLDQLFRIDIKKDVLYVISGKKFKNIDFANKYLEEMIKQGFVIKQCFISTKTRAENRINIEFFSYPIGVKEKTLWCYILKTGYITG